MDHHEGSKSMQLTEIKIAGFKSFVDPTKITLPSKLVAIVGPNGCGKSNIIDAVTWVMGESSPKYLRGESLTDVIFNGSSARKPVGQASVELVFDNSDASIGGEYATYAEISIKRVINRDSDSTYYINGARCRKRDVVDIFLGTGLGPRSYSIVGQNMISRVIEAKPDDLRSYLEEAAGISKYKERRHETELRIGHTKENLARVNDVRIELEKQLAHLKHQANVAEKFKLLKQQERVTRAEYYGIQWRHVDSKLVEFTLNIQKEETGLEARNSDLVGTDREIEQMRHEQRVAHDAHQEVQRRYYAVGNEITRIEQDILHHQEREAQWEAGLKSAEDEWQSIKDQMGEVEDHLYELEHDLEKLQPEWNNANREMQRAQEELQQAEQASLNWQTRWDDFNQTSAKSNQIAQVEKTRIAHLEEKIAGLQKRQDQLQQEQGKYNFNQLNDELEVINKQSYEAADKLEYQHRQFSDFKQRITTLQSSLQDSQNTLDNLRSELQKLRGQQASLEALQQTALGQRDNQVTPWINKHNLNENARLAQHIKVEKGWELAVEKVLGFCLQAICVDKLDELTTHLNEFKSGNISVFNTGQTSTSEPNNAGDLLLGKITSPWKLDSLLSGVYVAEDLNAALELCKHIKETESVITRDGIWVNRSWMKILKQDDPSAGVFQREEELKELSARITQLETTEQELEKNITDRRNEIAELERSRDQLQQAYNQQQAQAAQINAQHKMKQERLAELKAQSERFLSELSQVDQQLQKAKHELNEAKALWQKALQDLEEQAKSRETLSAQRDAVRAELQTVRNNANALKEQTHSIEIQLQTTKSEKGAAKQTLTRLQNQLGTLNERKIGLQSELRSMPPIDSLKKSLSRALDKHVGIESELNTTRVAMESLDQEFKQLETQRHTIERDINKHRNILEGLRVESQGYRVKSDTILEQIKETEFRLEDILRQIPQEATADEWQSKVDQLVNRINRLGAINLVAIEEYATCMERKQYLDKQYDDLQAGLTTLEEAIAKIDRETKTRFKETFDQVNQRFQELFPTIFGGGKAYLELTSEDLLEAGITMMACPPGKRNSSIYLLSGGEKSLTAIAFIFSIFYLNPAPFCMLDEVDAALDDANVVRYTRLVTSMAKNTQFIFISHNKISIEMAEHLIGVTMNEPGVSRLVSVDIEKAIGMAEA